MTMNNSSKIYFIRHSKLDLPYASHLEMPYEILDDLATSRLDPGIAPNSRELFLAEAGSLPLDTLAAIYYNNSGKQSRRSFASAQLIARIAKEKYGRDIPLVGNPDIKEVDFSLPDILSKAEFEKKGIPAVRTALYQAELRGEKVESIQSLYARIARVFDLIRQHRARKESILFVSHDFFMRVIEVYINITRQAEKVKLEDLENTTLNTYFKGFMASHFL